MDTRSCWPNGNEKVAELAKQKKKKNPLTWK